VIGLPDGWLPAWTDRNQFWVIDGDAMRWFGVVLFAIGAVLRIWPVFVLGDRFSGLVAIQPGHTLATTALVFSLGWGLAFRSGVGAVPPLLARIRSEEKLLQSQFGDEYDAYRARTSRMIPGLW
jgi:protein-S-isoprenylcysteine O-methyltransferase Ste14